MSKQALTDSFNRYRSFTRGLPRAVPLGFKPGFQYSDESIVSDLTVFWALFTGVYENMGGKPEFFKNYLTNDPQGPKAVAVLTTMLGECEYWEMVSPKNFQRITTTTIDFSLFAYTLRNGFAHYHWMYSNLSAIDYWDEQKWDRTGAPPVFNLAGRAMDNGTIYVADAKGWQKCNQQTDFWAMIGLRIVVIQTNRLRYWLHKFLHLYLNDKDGDVFENGDQ